MAWPKPNPRGRPKLYPEFVQAMRDRTPAAIKRLDMLARGIPVQRRRKAKPGEPEPSIPVVPQDVIRRANQAILEYAYGKAPLKVQIDDVRRPPLDLSVLTETERDMLEMVMSKLADAQVRQIEGSVVRQPLVPAEPDEDDEDAAENGDAE